MSFDLVKLLLTAACVSIISSAQAGKEFSILLSSNGGNVCVLDRPASTYSGFDAWSPVCIPWVVRCAGKCLADPNCIRFNFKRTLGLCEVYYRTPVNYTVAGDECVHFMVGYNISSNVSYYYYY